MMFFIVLAAGVGMAALLARKHRDWETLVGGSLLSLAVAFFGTMLFALIVNESFSKPVLQNTSSLTKIQDDSYLSVVNDDGYLEYTWRTKSDDGRISIETGYDDDVTVYETTGAPKVEVYHDMTPNWIAPWGSENWNTTYKIYLNEFDTKPILKGD